MALFRLTVIALQGFLFLRRKMFTRCNGNPPKAGLSL